MPPQIPPINVPFKPIQPTQPQPPNAGFGNMLQNLGSWWNRSAQRGQQITQQGGLGLAPRNPQQNLAPAETTLAPKDIANPNAPWLTGKGPQFTPVPQKQTQTTDVPRDTQGTPLPPNYQPYTGPKQEGFSAIAGSPQVPDQPQQPKQELNMQGQAVTGVTNPDWKGGWVGGQWIPAGQNPMQGIGPNYQPNSGLYGQLITGAANMAAGGSSGVQQAISNLQQFQKGLAGQYAGIEQQPIPLEFQQGREQVIARQAVGEQQALQTALQNQLQQQQLGQQGLLSAAGLAAPQPYGITTTPYQPVTGQFGTMPGGAGGAVNAGNVMAQLQAGQTGGMNQALIGKIIPMTQNLDALIRDRNINPTDATFVNQLLNWGRTNLFSDPAIPEFQGQLNDIVASLSGILGVPSSATSDFRTQLAGAIVNSLQKGQSISDAVNYFVQQAIQANQGYLAGARGSTPTGIGNPAFGQPQTNVSPQTQYTFGNGSFFGK